MHKGLAYIQSDGHTLFDDSLKTEDDVWQIALGWPTADMIASALEEGARVVPAVVLTKESKLPAAVIEHRHGSNIYVGVTHEALTEQVAAFCKEWWHEVEDVLGPWEALHDESELERIALYFQHHPNDGIVWLDVEGIAGL